MEQTNGRPRWTDVLHQNELVEERTAARLANMEKNLSTQVMDVAMQVAENKQAIAAVKDDVQTLKTAEAVRSRRSRDLFQLAGGLRGAVVTVAAIAALVLTLLNIGIHL